MSKARRLGLVLLLNLLLVAALVVVGVAAHSLGVLAAGVDYLADAAAIGVSLLAIWLTRRTVRRRPQRWVDPTHIAALINTGWLLALNVGVVVAAIRRLVSGAPEVHGLPVLIVSTVAAVVMFIGAIIVGGDLDNDDGAEDLNVKAVLLDTAADAAAAGGVAVTGAVILVTGGWFWLDPAVALALAVVIGYHGNASGARETLRAIEEARGQAALVQGDIADLATAERLVDTAVSRFGRLDVLCAHAGVTLFAPFLETTTETFDRLVATNLRGTYFTAQAAARRMVAQGDGGRIVLTSSVNARVAIETLSAYAVTKAGIEAMARNLAVELSPLGITVNAVAPGSTVNERNLAGDPAYAERWAAINPAARVGTGDDVLAAVRYLVGEEAGYITGQTIVVDGGWTAAGRAPGDVESLAERLRTAGRSDRKQD